MDKEFLLVPCGRCLACKDRYKQSWANRLIEHGRDVKCKFFCDLTYNDLFLPFVDSDGRHHRIIDNYSRVDKYHSPIDSDTYPATLSKRDVTLFLKRFRKNFPYRISYFLVGEYGEFYSRPHYHFLLFIEDSDAYVSHDELVTFINAAWSRHIKGIKQKAPMGFCSVFPVSDRDIRYTCKYELKQQLPDDYSKAVEKPFMICSQHIGAAYLEKTYNHDFHRNGMRFYYPLDNGIKSYLPRYWKDNLFTPHEVKLYAAKCEHDARLRSDFADPYVRHKQIRMIKQAELNRKNKSINSVKFNIKVK